MYLEILDVNMIKDIWSYKMIWFEQRSSLIMSYILKQGIEDTMN